LKGLDGLWDDDIGIDLGAGWDRCRTIIDGHRCRNGDTLVSGEREKDKNFDGLLQQR
jgi:hypothetical protein